jgi:hypothetical protein
MSLATGPRATALLEPQGRRLEAAGMTAESVLDALARLAAGAATGEAIPREHVLKVLGPGAAEVLAISLDVGFLTPSPSGTGLVFSDDGLRAELCARTHIVYLAGEYMDQGRLRDSAVDCLIRLGVPAVPVLVDALNEPDAAVGLGASIALRDIGAPARPALIRVLRMGNRRMRRWAVAALRSPDSAAAALPALLEAFAVEDQALVRLELIGTLACAQDPEAVKALVLALDDDEPMIRQHAESLLKDREDPWARRALDAYRRHGPRTPHDAWTVTASGPKERPHHAQGPRASRPRVFISYPREKFPVASEVRRGLSAAGFDPWMDSEGLLAGEGWELRIAEAMRGSDFVVALISRDTAGGYQEKELRMALDHAPEGRGAGAEAPFVVPCLVDPSMQFNAVPAALATTHAIMLTDFARDWETLHRALVQASRSAGLTVPIGLRSEPLSTLSIAGATRMIVLKDFYDSERNEEGISPVTKLVPLHGGAVVKSPATGRLWTTRCYGPFPFQRMWPELSQVNEQSLFGYTDWRVPTLEEAMSLMRSKPRGGGVYLAEEFSDEKYVVTADRDFPRFSPEQKAWIVEYGRGTCRQVPIAGELPVRLVRTAWK